MGETIKGISVVIGAETTGLTKALADVNKATRGTQGELREVAKLLKMDPGNTELLAQKQKLLGDAVQSSKEKLDRLKAAQEQVNAQFARGDIGESQYRAFNREVAAAEQQLARFETQLAATSDGLEEVGDTAESSADKMKAIGEKTQGVGEKMSVAISAPIVAAGGLMLKGALDAQNAQSKLQASLGLTAEEATAMGKVAQQVWNDAFGETIEEVDAAIATVRKNMGALSDEELKKVTEGAMTIADIFDADVVDSTKAAGTMMKNFGISGTDALDILTVGFQKGGDYSGELLDTMNEYAPVFASMGLSADQAMGMLLAGANAGSFSLDKVGDAMKEFNIRAQDGSKGTQAGFQAIGLDAEKMGASIAKGGADAQNAFTATVTALAAMKDPMEQNAAGTALFGTQWEDVKAKVIISMQEGIKGIGDFKGATDTASKAMYDNNPASALTSAMRGLQSAIGPALLPLASIITTSVVPALKTMTEWFTNLGPAGQKTVLVLLAIAAAIGPVLVIIGTLISACGSIAAGFATVSASVTAAGGVIAVLTGPIGIAIAIIAALIAIGVLLYKNWDGIKDTAVAFGKGVAAVFTEFEAGASATINAVIGFFKNFGTGVAETFKGFTTEASGAIKLVIGYFKDIGTSLTGFSSAASGVVNSVIGYFQNFGSKVGEVFNGFKNAASNAINAVKEFFDNLHLPEIKIPKIKLPHFSLTGSFSLSPPSVPHMSVDWYAAGGIFNSPTVIGVGEAGTEAVVPIDRLSDLMADALKNAGGTSGGTSEVRHTGTITVKGVTSAGEIQGVIDIILDNLGMEARLA